MKTFIIIFVICINYVLSQNDTSTTLEEKYAVRNYPKKVRPYGNGKILINSGKYMFKKSTTESPEPLTDRRPAYTVFQVVGNSKGIQGVPDSPYFPVDQPHFDHKPRVKKVLPDYTWTALRSKRSADNDAAPSNDKRDEKVESPKAVAADKKENKDDSVARKNKEEKSDNKETTEMHTEKKENEITKADNKDAKTDAPKKETSDSKVDKAGPKMRSTSDNSTTVIERKESKGGMNVTTTETAGQKNATSEKSNARAGGKTKQKRKKGKKGKKRSAQKRNKKRGSRSKTVVVTTLENGTRTFKSPKVERRLIAAREALIEDYPYMVSIQKNEQHWCSGALLNPRLVITTANCLWKAKRVSRMEIRAGSRNIERGGQQALIQEVMKHPGWGLRRNPDNDVALVLLDRNIRFSDSVHSVDIPNRVMMPPFDDAWVTSWGAERRDGIYDTSSSALQVYHTRLIDRAKCNNVTMRFNVFVTENFICLAQSGKTAPCTRDTGAPAVSDGILWGLASWGIRKLCGTERFPAMFSYLASHSNLDFITNATHLLMSDKRYYPFADRYPRMDTVKSSASFEKKVFKVSLEEIQPGGERST